MRYLSLFSGLEAAHVALSPLGWNCVAVSEIEPAACDVLAHRLPHVPNLGDITKITEDRIAALRRIDVVIGGSPCQDLSVAGKRAGLGGERSGLFHEQLRVFYAARKHCGARWLVWENVPGAFSTRQGRDFAVVVGEMAGCRIPVPADGWGTEGVALGEHGLVEWAVLDSQWFGVAQRRRRVFAVLDTGDWANRPPVLLEPESLRGDSAPRRETGEGITGTLSARPSGGGGLGTDFECQGGLVPEVSPAVTSKWAKGTGGPAGDECQNLVPVAFDTTQITSKANYSNPKPGDPCHPIAAGAHPPAIAFHANAQADQLPTAGRDTSIPDALTCSQQVAVAYAIQERATSINPDAGPQGKGWQADHAYTLEARNTTQTVAVVFAENSRAEVRLEGGDGSLHVGQTPAAQPAHAFAVRRLTPREVERLQAAPDDWTLVPNGRGKPMADGPRYKMCGNTFTATVIRWIGARIQAAHEESKSLRAVA